jgi:hypothetical protein
VSGKSPRRNCQRSSRSTGEPETADLHQVIGQLPLRQVVLVTKIVKIRLVALPSIVRLAAPGPSMNSRGKSGSVRSQDDGARQGEVDEIRPGGGRWRSQSPCADCRRCCCLDW